MLLSLQILFFCIFLPNLSNFYTFDYLKHSLFRTKSLAPCMFEITDIYCIVNLRKTCFLKNKATFTYADFTFSL